MVACQHLNGLTLMGILHSLKWIKKDCFSENALLFLLCTVACLMQHSTCRNRSCMMGHCKEVTSSGALKKFLANWRWPFLNALISQIRVDNDTALILDERRPTAGECSWIWFGWFLAGSRTSGLILPPFYNWVLCLAMPIVCSLCGESGLTHAVLDDCSPEMYWPRLTVRPGRDVFGLLEFGRTSVESFLSAIDRVFGRWQGIWTDSGHSQYPNLEMWKNVIDWSWFCSRNHYWDCCAKECSFLCSTILCIYTFSLSGICSQPMQTSIGMCEGCQRNMVPLACPKTAQSALLPTEPPVIIDQGCGYCCSSG